MAEHGRKTPVWRRTWARVTAVIVLLLLLITAIDDPERDDRGGAVQRPPATIAPEATPTPDPAEAARAEAAALFHDGAYARAVDVLEDAGLRRAVATLRRRASGRLLASARRALRRGRYEAAKADAISARGFRSGGAVRAVLADADAGIARERAEARRRREQARLARDLRTCSSSEKLIVRAEAGTPNGCTGYAADVAARRAAREAERQAELAEEAAETSGGDCADGYDPCVPSFPPDLDCPDVGPVSVSGSDPHGLDADGDGVACGGD